MLEDNKYLHAAVDIDVQAVLAWVSGKVKLR